MKATIEIPDELYRQSEAKSSREGRALPDVMAELLRRYVGLDKSDDDAAESLRREASQLLGNQPVPSWFAVLRKRVPRGISHDMSSIRESIGRGIARERGF